MMKTVLQDSNKNIDDGYSKNVISAENAHVCGVVYEIETIPSENSNSSPENSKHFGETEMVQQSLPNALDLTHENKSLSVINEISKDIEKQNLCNNVSRYKDKHIVDDVNSSEKQLNNNKIGRQKLKHTVSYNENINADNRSMDNSLNAGSKSYYSCSSSTMSSLTESSTSEKYIDSVSPEAHLSN
uniref:SJCHGC07851 protein n=1 Tax=Schistosoma japonicum TaxID=6182 RepID=Q5DAN3_SCHJA|nr:SJCHGC07851 protein [Schistosoma japonicum]